MLQWMVAAAVLALGSPDGGAASAGGAAAHFDVSATFRPAKAGGAGEVEVTFSPRDPDVKVNAKPAPRLKLDAGQKVLADKPGPPAAGSDDEKYLDTTFPVVFPVSVVSPPGGEQTVKGTLTYYYCSQRQGWCRKGTALLDIPVKAR